MHDLTDYEQSLQRGIDRLDAENERLRAVNVELLEACRLFTAWLDADEKGPDYGSLTRDTHPDGEVIWRQWWDRNQRLCQLAIERSRVAIAKATDLSTSG